MSKNVVIVFTRNPELGKVKTRLAAKIGNQAALKVYNLLLQHTERILNTLKCDIAVYYSNKITTNDIWNKPNYHKFVQEGEDLGQRMQNAFKQQFELNYQNIVIIGSDLFDLKPKHIQQAFKALEQNDFVIGPAKDGGYYLLGMTALKPQIFQHKNWGTNSVFNDTIIDLKPYKTELLEPLNDIDTFEDLKAYSTIINQINKKINEELY